MINTTRRFFINVTSQDVTRCMIAINYQSIHFRHPKCHEVFE